MIKKKTEGVYCGNFLGWNFPGGIFPSTIAIHNRIIRFLQLRTLPAVISIIAHEKVQEIIVNKLQ